MSIRLMSAVWDIEWPSQSVLLIALKLADYADDNGGNVYPARATLAKKAQTSLATVKRTVASLRSSGILMLVEQGGRGPKDTTEYRLNVELLAALQRGQCKIVKTEEGFRVVCENEPDKGLTVSPLDGELRGSPDAEGAHQSELRGSPGEPQSTNLEPPLRNSTARERASEFSKPKGKVKSAVDCAVSPEARTEARQAAPGWDIRELEKEWRAWNDAQDIEVSEPDKAFLGFCRKRGPHPDAKRFKPRTPVPAEYRDRVLKPRDGEIIIDRLGAYWQPWLDHLSRISPQTEKLARRSFAMAVTSLRPQPGSPLPRIQPMPVPA